MSFAATKQAVLGRVRRRPEFELVPEHMVKLFDRVIEQNESEALRRFPDKLANPDAVWERIQFWKEEVLDVTLPELRGVIAGWYHEYHAAMRRGDDLELADPYGFTSRPYNPYAEGVAQRDAYLAVTASLR